MHNFNEHVSCTIIVETIYYLFLYFKIRELTKNNNNIVYSHKSGLWRVVCIYEDLTLFCAGKKARVIKHNINSKNYKIEQMIV